MANQVNFDRINKIQNLANEMLFFKKSFSQIKKGFKVFYSNSAFDFLS